MKIKVLIKLLLSTALVKYAGKGLSLIVSIILAKKLGPENFGYYSFVMSLLVVATIPSTAGLPQLIIRELSRLTNIENKPKREEFLKWTTTFILIMCTCVVLIIIFAWALGLYDFGDESIVWIILALVYAKSFSSQYTAILAAYQRPALSQFGILIIVPSTIILLMFIFERLALEVSISSALTFNFVGFLTCLLVLYLVVSRSCKVSFLKFDRLKITKGKWLNALIPLSLVSMFATMNNEFAILFLGLISEDVDVAYYRVAFQVVTLVALFSQVVNVVTAPKISSFYKEGKHRDVQNLLNKSVTIGFCFSLIVVGILSINIETVVLLLFGADYLPSAILITILLFGQVVNAASGNAGLVLNMTGNERQSLKVQIKTVIFTCLLLGVLIPLYGAIGAAIAVTLSLTIWNVLMVRAVYLETRLKTWVRFKAW
ncbi:oligosaccharide flippase family protein [Vibrio astriarenae]